MKSQFGGQHTNYYKVDISDEMKRNKITGQREKHIDNGIDNEN